MANTAIILINYKNPKITLECVESLIRLQSSDYTIYVVDNAADENTKGEFERSILFQYIKYIPSKDNLGFAGGNNIAIQRALDDGCDYIMLLNNDTVVDSSFLDEMKRYCNSKTVVVPKIYYFDEPSVLWYAGGIINWISGDTHHTGAGKVDDGSYDKVEKVEFASGCCILMNKNVIEKVGMLDESYFMFARLRGIKVVFTTHEYSNRSFLGRMRQIPSFLFANEIIVVDPQFEVDIKKIPLCKKKVRTIRIGSNIVPSVAPNDKIIELHNSLVKDNMKLMSYFGFINEYKCFLELVEAIKHLKDAGKLKSKLVVIGELKESDEYHKKVLEKIREYNLDNDIIVTGYLKDSVGDYLKASDFAVLPFYYGISVRNGSFLAAYQEGIDIITTKGDKNFPYDDVYLMNDNTPQTIASAIEYMQDNSLKSEHRKIDFYWDDISKQHVELYEKIYG